MMKNKQTQILTLALVIAVSLAGCKSGGGSKGNSSTGAPTTSGDALALANNDPYATLSTDSGTVGVRSGLALKTSMATMTGVDLSLPSANNINTFYTSNRSNLSGDGSAGSVSPAMLMAVSQMAALFCTQLIANDRAIVQAQAATRKVFTMLDLVGNQTQLSTAVRAQLIRKYANQFWQRNESTTEYQALDQAITDTLAGAASSNASLINALLVTCTASLGSLEAIKS